MREIIKHLYNCVEQAKVIGPNRLLLRCTESYPALCFNSSLVCLVQAIQSEISTSMLCQRKLGKQEKSSVEQYLIRYRLLNGQHTIPINVPILVIQAQGPPTFCFKSFCLVYINQSTNLGGWLGYFIFKTLEYVKSCEGGFPLYVIHSKKLRHILFCFNAKRYWPSSLTQKGQNMLNPVKDG